MKRAYTFLIILLLVLSVGAFFWSASPDILAPGSDTFQSATPVGV